MNDTLQVFRIPKRTGTHADVFAVVGLADLLASVPDVGAVRMVEREAEFEVRLSQPLAGADLRRIPQTPGYPFLKTNEKVTVPAGVTNFVDYKAEKAKADRRKQVLGPKAKKGQKVVDPETQQLIQQEQLRDDWRLLQVLNTLQGDETANKVHGTIASRELEKFCEELAVAFAAVCQQRTANLDWKISTVQLFTPIAAKGYSRLKPDSTDRNDKTKEQWADPFVEWLKYRGYFQVACPFFQGPKAEHVRLLCPIPHDISLRALASVARELRTVGVYGGPPKMDALAVLRLAELLVRHSEEYHDLDAEVFPGLFLKGKTPAEAISGIMVTHYQSLGNAKAVSAMSTIALPGWFPIESQHDAEDWLAILDEHQRIVRGLQDDHSDEIGLLIAYRRFLEKRSESAIWALVEFMEHYGPFLIRAREQKRKVRSFRADYFRRIVMGIAPKLTEILHDQGFQAVAAAVRRATVNAQAQKAMGKSDYREIRYDLLHDLRRKRSLPGVAPLTETVSEFISKYNVENARRREMRKPAPRNVTTEEFMAFAALIERYGASMVGALLCAYGSCREPREEDAPEPTEDETKLDEQTT
ncbi:MAG: hypothetical protein HYZ72_20875 [Deltaproteobacteria bacterium]|nr:hypothetical protein [Deltaproteobacteria bacterium]